MDKKPEKPSESDCCSSGCKPCIFDVYEEKLKHWESKRIDVQSKALNQLKYLPFVVTNVDSISDILKTFNFQAVSLKENGSYDILHDNLGIKSGEYLILKGSYNNEVISRSYTPVLDKDKFEKGGFQIIVSLIPNGKMSEFLGKLKQNDIVYWRGPYKEFSCSYKSFKNILLIGGGTGVVPLYNISKSIVESDEEIWVNVFASFKTTNSILLRKEFKRLKDFWNFKITTFISGDESADFQASYNETVVFEKMNESIIVNEMKKYNENECFVVVCGPDSFNKFVKNCLGNFGVKNENIFIFW